MSQCDIPFNRSSLLGRELEYIFQTMTIGQIAGDQTYYFLPLHLSPIGLKLGGRNAECPVSEQKSDRLVRLPFFNTLSRACQDQVIQSIMDFRE